MTADIVATLVEHFGLGAIMLWLWWQERRERIKLADHVEELHAKLEQCIEGQTPASRATQGRQ